MSILSRDFLILVTVLTAVNYILPVRWRWMALLAGSMVFYAGAGWQGLAYLGVVTLLTWLGGWCLGANCKKEKAASQEGDKAEAYRIRRRRKWAQALIVTLVIGGMAVIKYADLLHAGVNALYMALVDGAKTLDAWSLFVPLGLSYFTFQSVGYVVDCARGKVHPEKNPLRYLLFVSFFPQITQGPITTWQQLAPQLREPARFEPSAFVAGFQLAMWGYFKKLVLADRLATVTDYITRGKAMPGWLILLGVALYTIRLYADFSGGMDVIRGAAKMLGIDMAENFRRPFFSTSVAEYWRRWHISLGTWFRTYLFYPLTTSRFGLALSRGGQKLFGKKVGRMLPGAMATFIIFLLIGIWHTANWNAVIYGAYFGVLLSAALLIEPLLKKLRTRLHIPVKSWWWKGIGLIRTWLMILLPQYFAFTAGPEKGWGLLCATFRNWTFTGAAKAVSAVMDPLEWYIALIAMGIVFVVDLLCERKVDVNGRLARGSFLIRWPILIALIMATLVFGCYGAGFDASAFLYTQF